MKNLGSHPTPRIPLKIISWTHKRLYWVCLSHHPVANCWPLRQCRHLLSIHIRSRSATTHRAGGSIILCRRGFVGKRIYSALPDFTNFARHFPSKIVLFMVDLWLITLKVLWKSKNVVSVTQPLENPWKQAHLCVWGKTLSNEYLKCSLGNPTAGKPLKAGSSLRLGQNII
jgi:hypothetical protein